MKNPKLTEAGGYSSYIRRKRLLLLLIFLAAFLILAVEISVGSSNLPLPTVIRTLLGGGTEKERIIVLNLRLPRALTAVAAGFGLGMIGCVMQSVLRNPLVSASTVGISQGASFGAAFAIIVLGAGVETVTADSVVNISQPYLVSACAFGGAMLSTSVIMIIARVKRQTSATLVLTGVALGSFFSGITTLLEYFADDVHVAAVVHWSFGNIGGTSMKEIAIMGTVVAAAFLYFFANRWNYNAFQIGDETAKGLGVKTEQLLFVSMVICAFTSAAIVSYIGIVSFVGLIAPHLVRKMMGSDYRFMIPASGLVGAMVMLLSDTAARIAVPPIVLPIGAITSFVGALTFLWIVLREKRAK